MMGMGGPGMMGMGGPGMMGMGGPGMMGMGMFDLSDAQRKKMRDIQRGMRKSHFNLMEKMSDDHEALADLYRTDHPDPKKVGIVYGRIFALKRQMIESSIDASNRMRDVLTKEQRDMMQQMRGGMGMGMYGGPGNRSREDMHRNQMMR